jgi:hypothetical protein
MCKRTNECATLSTSVNYNSDKERIRSSLLYVNNYNTLSPTLEQLLNVNKIWARANRHRSLKGANLNKRILLN